MKRILFSIQHMRIGGIERSLIELLKVLPLNEYEIHVVIFDPDMIFFSPIPKEVHIHQISRPSKVILQSLLKSFHWIDACAFLCLWIYGKVFHDSYRFFRHKYRNEPVFMDGVSFDLVSAYHGSAEECCYYAFEKVRSKVKCIWIHDDVSQMNLRYEMLMRFSQDLSKIFLPCMESKKRFDKKYPCLKDKTDVIKIVIPVNEILMMAETGKTFNDNFVGKRILTVGRLHPVKGQHQAIKALKIILEHGLHVRWYFVGDGESMAHCQQLARNIGVNDSVVFLGPDANPYSYMRDCDVYVQPSLQESFCITLSEALCFGNPIVCTNFCGVDQMDGRPNGHVTDFSVEAIAHGVEKAINDKKIVVSPIQEVPNMDILLHLI